MQFQLLRKNGIGEIIISTNNDANKKLFEVVVADSGLDNITVISNVLHKGGSLWGLQGALDYTGFDDTLFCFSDIYFFDFKKIAISTEISPWLSYYKSEDLRGGVIETDERYEFSKKLYYKTMPKRLKNAVLWSGLTHITKEEINLLPQFLKGSVADIPEEDYINYCIKNGSTFKTFDLGCFTNINSQVDLNMVRSINDPCYISSE